MGKMAAREKIFKLRIWGKNKKGENHFLLISFSQPPHFSKFRPPPAVVVGKQVKDCWGEKWAGKNDFLERGRRII